MVLRRSCREYPDMTALNKRLKELYGARLEAEISKRGEIQIITLYFEALCDEYALENEQILKACTALLKSVIFDPLLENNQFKADDTEIEKHNLVDLIDSQLNDKRYYASLRLKQVMCKNEAYGVYEFGEREAALAITTKDLYTAWVEMLTSAKVEIFLVGNSGEQACREMLSSAFSNIIRRNIVKCDTQVIRDALEVKTIEERLPINQAKLGLGFRAGIATPDADVAAMQLASTVLGGSPHSKLFLNVREKLSLCYYCYARYERQKGLLIIESGIEEQNYEKAKAEILHQLDELKAGNFTDDDLNFAALSLQNSYTELNDTLGGIAGWYLGQALLNTNLSPAQAAEEVMSLGRDDIIKAASKIKLDTVYLLAATKEG